jgi:hypothetical protein
LVLMIGVDQQAVPLAALAGWLQQLGVSVNDPVGLQDQAADPQSGAVEVDRGFRRAVTIVVGDGRTRGRRKAYLGSCAH